MMSGWLQDLSLPPCSFTSRDVPLTPSSCMARSLLVFFQREGIFRHFDSSRGLNDRPAKKLAVKMHQHLGYFLANTPVNSSFSSAVSFVALHCLRIATMQYARFPITP